MQAEITERSQTLKKVPFQYRGSVFVKKMVQPDHIPIPPGATIGVNGTDIFLVTLQQLTKAVERKTPRFHIVNCTGELLLRHQATVVCATWAIRVAIEIVPI